MVQVDYIRFLYYQQHQSIRSISRDLHCSRKTVRKALRLEDVREHRYHISKPRLLPVMGPYMEIIKTWLLEDATSPRKQRHTARRIYQRLKEEYGFPGSEESVRRTVRQLKQAATPQEVFIPLEFALGEAAQCDWGEASVYIGGQLTKVYLFCMRLCASRVSFVRAYLHEKQEAFFEGHRLAFEFFGGVPQRVIYDNLKHAVKKILTGSKREEQEAFLALKGYYVFEADFCGRAAANQKGQVEHLVKYARRNFLVPVPQVASLEELNALLEERCLKYAREHHVPDAGPKVAEVWAREKEVLLALPPRPFDCCRRVMVKSDSYSRVQFETNRYSVPTPYARKDLLLKAYVDRIEVWAGTELVSRHERAYGRYEEHLDPRHYLEELAMKPRAIPNARPLKNGHLPPVWAEVLAELAPGGKEGLLEFQRILELEPLFGPDVLSRALVLTRQEHKPYTLVTVRETAASLSRQPDNCPAPYHQGSLIAPFDLEHFDALLAGR